MQGMTAGQHQQQASLMQATPEAAQVTGIPVQQVLDFTQGPGAINTAKSVYIYLEFVTISKQKNSDNGQK